MHAVINGNSELAQLLVDHDAQVDCTYKHLRTALHRAVSSNFSRGLYRAIGWFIV